MKEARPTSTSGTNTARWPRYATITWILLLVLGAFFVFAPLSDLAAGARTGLPTDHLGTFQSLAGTPSKANLNSGDVSVIQDR